MYTVICLCLSVSVYSTYIAIKKPLTIHRCMVLGAFHGMVLGRPTKQYDNFIDVKKIKLFICRFYFVIYGS